MQAFRPILHRTPPLISPLSPTPSTRLLRPTNHNRQQTRTFLPNPFAASSTPQTISATRTLPYATSAIYAVISDVNSYATYYPFCTESRVTKYSRPTAHDGKKYPEEAKLVIGFGDAASEAFYSRVYCVPERIVEAVSGEAESTIPAEEIGHHDVRPSAEDRTRVGSVLEHLSTRWTLRALEREKTEVSLRIEVKFANPVYAALSQAAVPKVAEKLIEAFERRLEVVAEGRGKQ
ncbi:hypothetical protein BDY17DRAFT_318225 [Neohortaea acidophila]|uniref:Coenzyme Q-binding protein COQ10 START domain-containing protein n=1 Tax=Neohortaea acidophila TaxID=245834 RepID=A0A6A6PKE1_9PEZI|nr:uncharacterized protein BDY17DRAFT_318225 [Neohortaea acidophila]KAF2480548.1 hypothetical protein BDY17DRAFT_318225 [Neohortaea acidophila]